MHSARFKRDDKIQAAAEWNSRMLVIQIGSDA